MAKFSSAGHKPRARSPIQTTNTQTVTHEGGLACAPDPKSELVITAAGLLSGEGSFYEDATERDARFRNIVRQVTNEDADFVARFAPYLRKSLMIRSASVVLAAEYVAAGGPNGRQVVDSVLQRGDEPAEMIGYWLGHYGRSIPAAIKRGTADAVRRLYTERNALRYNGDSRGVRMADVIELVHPRAESDAQNALFKWLLDNRHHDETDVPSELEMLAANRALLDLPVEQRRAHLRQEGVRALSGAGMTWERLSSWLPDGMDAEAWEAVIPHMGVMALIRNLRNFEEASISAEARGRVASRISDPDEVAKSRVYPYQIWSACNASASDDWKAPLGKAFDFSTRNLPTLPRTLVLIDASGSMTGHISRRSKVTRADIAACMGAAAADNSSAVDLALFGREHKMVSRIAGESPLATTARLWKYIDEGVVGHATYGHTAIDALYDKKRHDRVIVFTDDQMHDSGRVDISHVPAVYFCNLGGYMPQSTERGSAGRYTIAGFSDSLYSLIEVLEAGRNANWPF